VHVKNYTLAWLYMDRWHGSTVRTSLELGLIKKKVRVEFDIRG